MNDFYNIILLKLRQIDFFYKLSNEVCINKKLFIYY